MRSNEELIGTTDQAGTKRNAKVIKALLIKVDGGEGQSKALSDGDDWGALSGKILDPPFDPLFLTQLPEMNTEMTPCLDAMAVNCDGFGYRLKGRLNLARPDIPEATKKEAEAERVRLTNFFGYASLERSFTNMRMARRRDFETTGNGYFEIIRSASGEVQGIEQLPSYTMRLSPKDKKPIPVEVPILELQVDGSVRISKVRAWRRFRRYAQIRDAVTRWFKEFGDPRIVDCESGDYVGTEDAQNWKGTGMPMPEEQRANEVKHWPLYTGRSPYGVPRYMGALLAIFGDREAETINFTTFKNNNIPSMIIAISNGQLTQESVDRITQFSESNIQGRNYSKFLVLESEGAVDGDEPGNVKIDIKPLSSEQKDDALFMDYSKENRDKVRRQWRLPPILVGRADDYTRATADTSRRLADEQVFAPERDAFDEWINRELFPHMGVIYHKFHSNSPNTTDNSELVRILAGSEKTGGMTPRVARMILEDVLNTELPPLSDKYDSDVPFSLTMAEAVKNLGNPVEPGQSVTALKAIDELTSDSAIERLLGLRDRLDKVWREEAFGEGQGHVEEGEDEG